MFNTLHVYVHSSMNDVRTYSLMHLQLIEKLRRKQERFVRNIILYIDPLIVSSDVYFIVFYSYSRKRKPSSLEKSKSFITMM